MPCPEQSRSEGGRATLTCTGLARLSTATHEVGVSEQVEQSFCELHSRRPVNCSEVGRHGADGRVVVTVRSFDFGGGEGMMLPDVDLT